MNDTSRAVVVGQFRCPKCRKNVNGMVKVNKYTFGFPHMCLECAEKYEPKHTPRNATPLELAGFLMSKGGRA